MRFQTGDENDIVWMRDFGEYSVADVVRKIKDAGKWDALLAIEADAEGVVDCDALYELLRHESREALRLVGLHEAEATATPMEVVEAWAKAYAGEGLKVSYCEDGKTPSGLALYDYGTRIGTCIEFECVDKDGEVDSVSLDEGEVLALVSDKSGSFVDRGAWSSEDVDDAVFEMWSED